MIAERSPARAVSASINARFEAGGTAGLTRLLLSRACPCINPTNADSSRSTRSGSPSFWLISSSARAYRIAAARFVIVWISCPSRSARPHVNVMRSPRGDTELHTRDTVGSSAGGRTGIYTTPREGRASSRIPIRALARVEWVARLEPATGRDRFSSVRRQLLVQTLQLVL